MTTGRTATLNATDTMNPILIVRRPGPRGLASPRPALATLLGLLGLLLGFLPAPRAEIPEPDNVFYGVITLGITPVTAAQTDVVVEARKTAAGPVVSQYRMGDNPAYGNSYSLEIPLEAFVPLTDTNASRVGAIVYLSVRDNSGVRDTRTVSIAQRGQLVRLDFTERDTDNDGIPDRWEQQYFGSATGADPAGDPDGDGRTNLEEYLAGTNPRVADGRHPADKAPADNLISQLEVDDYVNAWLAGDPWSLAPTNIPIAYVTRAMSLAAAGGSYVFTNLPPTNAPLSWVSLSLAATPRSRTNVASASMPTGASPGQTVSVAITVHPDPAGSAYAAEDQVPSGWEVQSISHGGSFDSRNHKVKWGPFPDTAERVMTYDVAVGGTGSFSFAGTASFDGFNIPVSGPRQLTVSSGAVLRWTTAGLGAQGPFFVLSAQSSHAYIIESSTDLAHWQTVQTATTDANGLLTFRPAAPSGSRYRFYRARAP